MLMRLILIGAVISLIAAFMGQRRLAICSLAGLAVAALALWGYESYQIHSQGELFAQNDIVISEVKVTPASYRPNLLELTGHIRNNSKQTTLDGVQLKLQLQDCFEAKPCRALTARQQYVATKLGPGDTMTFQEDLYLDKADLPKGKLKLNYSVGSLSGHRPIW